MKNENHMSIQENVAAEQPKINSLSNSQIQSADPLSYYSSAQQQLSLSQRQRRTPSSNSFSIKQAEKSLNQTLPVQEMADGIPQNQEEVHSSEASSSSLSQRSNSQGQNQETSNVSSKVNSNSATSRSDKGISKGSRESLHDSNPQSNNSASNSGSRVFKPVSNGSSNNSFAVVSAKTLNLNEFTTTICSKEEIKESINVYRCGKPRESLITTSLRLPVKPLVEESKNQIEDKTFQNKQDQQKSTIQPPIVKGASVGIQLNQRRGNTLSRNDIDDLAGQLAEISMNPVEKSSQNAETISKSLQSKSQGIQDLQGLSSEKHQSNFSAAHAVFTDFSSQEEEEGKDSPREPDGQSPREEGWDQQSEEDDFADQQVKKQVAMLNSDDSEEEPIELFQQSAKQNPSKPCIFQPISVIQTTPVGTGLPFQLLASSSPQQQQIPQDFDAFQIQLQPQHQQLSQQTENQLISQLPPAYLSQQQQADFLQTKKAFGRGNNSFGASFFDPLQMQSQQQQMASQLPSFVFENQPNNLPQQIFPPMERSSPALAQMMPFQMSLNPSPSQSQQQAIYQNISPMMMQTTSPTVNQSSQQFYPNQSPQQIYPMRPRGHLQISPSSLFSSHSNSSYSLQSQQFQQQQFQLQQQQQQQQLAQPTNNCGYSQASTADSDLVNTFRSSFSASDKQAEIVKFIQLQQQQQQQHQQLTFSSQNPSAGFELGYFKPDSAPFFSNYVPDSYASQQLQFQQQIQQQQQQSLQKQQFQQKQQIYIPPGNVSAEEFLNSNNASSLLDVSDNMAQSFQQQQLANNYRPHHSKQLSCLQFGQSSSQQQQQLQQYQAMAAAGGLLLNSSSMNLTATTSSSNNSSSSSQVLGKGKKKLEIKEETVKYDIDLDRLEQDGRTTVYIKNIPNKYTLNCVLQTIQKNHSDNFDFFYLPIDFQNKCNVGYAFINFITPAHIRDFFLEFNGKKWKKFNSDKICNLKYARIQGRVQLEEHFQNSSVMNQREKKFKPVFLSISDLIQSQKQIQQQEQQQYSAQFFQQQQFYQQRNLPTSTSDQVQNRHSSFSNHQSSTVYHANSNSHKQHAHHPHHNSSSFKHHPKQEYYVQKQPQP